MATAKEKRLTLENLLQRQKQTRLEDLLHSLQNRLSYERHRLTELEDQLAKLKGVHGDWSTWACWSDCTRTCGGGQRKQLRTCTNPTSTNGGRECVGDSQDIDHCNNAACPPPVHGDWSTWGSWGDCSRTCGEGQRTRLRTCTNPAPTNGGQECVGDSQDIDHCNNAACLPPVLRHAWVIGGGPGDGVNQFYHPEDVAASPAGGRFYVADSGNSRVKIYNDDGTFIKTFGTEGQSDGQFGYPIGVAVNCHEDVIISDFRNNRVVVCDRESQLKYTVGTKGSNKGQINGPQGVAVDMSDNIYICDWNNNRIQVFTRTGEFIRQFGRAGSAPGELFYPMYVSVAMTTGRVYVTEQTTHRVSVFTAEGDSIFTFGTAGEANGEMMYPRGIDIDECGFVILAERNNHRIQVFDPDGMFITTFGGYGVKNGQFNHPLGVAIMQNGDVIVTEYDNNRIQIVSK